MEWTLQSFSGDQAASANMEMSVVGICERLPTFAASRGRFERKVGPAGRAEAANTHGELEEWLELEAREPLRQMYQNHLDVRALLEPRPQSEMGAD